MTVKCCFMRKHTDQLMCYTMGNFLVIYIENCGISNKDFNPITFRSHSSFYQIGTLSVEACMKYFLQQIVLELCRICENCILIKSAK